MAEKKNQVTKVENASPVKLGQGQKFQVDLMNELDASMKVMDLSFSDYGRKCVVNAIGALILHCQTNNMSLKQINMVLLKTQLQNVGLTELNCAALPSEAYFDLRKTKEMVEVTQKDGTTKKEPVYSIAFKPQGAGNEKLVRKYGVGLKKDTGLHQAILIHEGDKVTMPQYEGSQITPLKIETSFENIDKKVIAVAYVAIKTDDTEDYLIATREGIKPNIVAQIRQNTLYEFKKPNSNYEVDEKKRDEFYAKLDADAETMKVDELLNAYKEYVNPTYTSGGSKEAMILRKMKNNALKLYPKEYDNTYIKNAVEGMFEENDPTVLEKPKALREDAVDVVEKVEKEIAEESAVENAPQDFKVDGNGEVVKDVESKDKEPAPATEEKPAEEKPAEEKKDKDPF